MYAKQIFELIAYFFDGASNDEKDEFRLDEDMVRYIKDLSFKVRPQR